MCAETRTPPAPESRPPYYTSERVDWLIRNWELLEALAETPGTSRHCLSLDHRYCDGPCKPAPKIGSPGKGHRADALAYADVRADIESAAKALRPTELAAKVVRERLRNPGSLRQIARRVKARKGDVGQAYRTAVKAIADRLEQGPA